MNRSTVIGSVLLIAGTLAGCSSSSSGSQTSPAKGQSSGPTSSMPSMSSMASMSSMQSMSSTAPASSPAAAGATITIKDFKFTVTGKISPGAKIMVRNDDGEAHTVTADKGGFDVTVAPSKTVVLTAPAKAGGYPFHCTFHSNMHGTLTVS